MTALHPLGVHVNTSVSVMERAPQIGMTEGGVDRAIFATATPCNATGKTFSLSPFVSKLLPLPEV